MYPDFTRCYASRGKLSHGIFKYMQWWIGLTVLLKFLQFSESLKRNSQYPDPVTFLLDHPRVAMCHTSLSSCGLLWQILQPILVSQSFYQPVPTFLRQPINEASMIAIQLTWSRCSWLILLFIFLSTNVLKTKKKIQKLQSKNVTITQFLPT